MPTDLELRQQRRDAILALLRRERVTDQADLVRRLRERGVEATQPSVSRDLRELGVVKAGGRYVLPEAAGPAARDLDSVAHFLRAVRAAGPHLTVVLTTSGAAQTVAIALDRSGWPEVAGTVAGDDTVFLATAGQRAQTRVLHRLERLLAAPVGGEIPCFSPKDLAPMTEPAYLAGAPIVLAFSGGLDTSYCVPVLGDWLRQPVVTVTVDTGGLDAATAADLERRARALGASAHHLVDAKQAYFDRVLKYLIFGNVRRGGVYPLCVGAERTIQAQEVARVARELGSGVVAHGCTAAGNDQVRFEVALRTLAPDLQVVAPVRDDPKPREEQVRYLTSRGLPLPASGGGAYSINRGLWGVTIGGRETLTSEEPLPEEAWVLSRGALDVPRAPERHRLSFERGVPVAWDGVALDPVALIQEVEADAARFAIGRGIHLGDTVLGTKGRVAFEAPAAEVVLTAHRELEKLVLTQRQQRAKDMAAALYGDLVHEGQHLEPAARDLEALLESAQQRVSGDVFLLFRPAALFVEGTSSPHSMLAASRGRYGEAAGDFASEDARGYSRLLAIPGVLHHRAGKPGSRP